MKCKKCGEGLTPTNIICQKCGCKNTNIDGESISVASNIMMCIFFLPMAFMNVYYFALDQSSHGADGYGFIFFGGILLNTLPIIIALILGVSSICKYYKVKNVKTKKRKLSNTFNILLIILFLIYYLWMNNIIFN